MDYDTVCFGEREADDEGSGLLTFGCVGEINVSTLIFEAIQRCDSVRECFVNQTGENATCSAIFTLRGRDM